jgi:pimeloyl-ACP methyl ester carboxylesterase
MWTDACSKLKMANRPLAGSLIERRNVMMATRHPRRRILFVVVLVFVALIVAVAPRSKKRKVESMGENRTTTSRDGTRIAFTKIGSGPPVVLVDGAFCYRDNGPASQLAPLLAQHFTVFAYDRRGRGQSGDAAPYSIELEVDDLRAVVEEAGGSPAFVVGISSGGALALHAVASLKVKKLALYEPPYVAADARGLSFEDDKKRLQQFLAAGDRAGAVKFTLTNVFGAPRPFVFVMPLLMRSIWKRNEGVAHTLPYDLTILCDRSVLKERRGSISVPTLVIGGDKSPKELQDAVSAVANAIPNGRSQFLAGQSHDLSAPALAPVLVDFFGASDSRVVQLSKSDTQSR